MRSWRRYLVGHDALIVQILAQAAHDLDLLLGGQPIDGPLDDAADRGPVHGDEALEVHEGEETHDELAVHAIRDPTVTWDRFPEILDVEGSLEARGEEAAKGCDERGKRGEDQDVELHRREGHGAEQGKPRREMIRLRHKGRIRCALEASPDVRAEILFCPSVCSPQLGPCRERVGLTVTGQMKYLYRIKILVKNRPKMTVMIQAPTKPSTVFLGDNLMSWVLPKVIPQM